MGKPCWSSIAFNLQHHFLGNIDNKINMNQNTTDSDSDLDSDLNVNP